jgi:hypothetical protein
VPLSASTEEAHPLLPVELLGRIEGSDPSLTALEISGSTQVVLGSRGGELLARSLSLNSCIISLNLSGNHIGSDGLDALLPAIAHLTGMTSLDLSRNSLDANDIARLCGKITAAGMIRLRNLILNEHPFADLNVSSVVQCETWSQLRLSTPPTEFVAGANFSTLIQFLLSGDRDDFAALYHPLLPVELIERIENSDPSLTNLEIIGDYEADSSETTTFLGARGGRSLARSLSLNSCITSLNLSGNHLGSDGLDALLPAIAHLTGMTSLDLSWNYLNANDVAHLCGAVAAAGMTGLHLELRDQTFFTSSVVQSDKWKELELPQPPSEIVRKGCDALIQYLISEDKVECRAIRMFFIGDSLVRRHSSLSIAIFTRTYFS